MKYVYREKPAWLAAGPSVYAPGIDRPVAASRPGAGAIRLALWGSPNLPSG